MLLLTNKERIYRRSYKADYHLYDIKTRNITPIDNQGGQSYATFSPDGSMIAFTRENNMFKLSIDSMQEKQLTFDGEFNHIINGHSDWVYEEEFSLAKGFFWSPDSRKIAYYTFNEMDVPEYNVQGWSGLYPHDYKFKYPKAGEDNSIVKISVYDLGNNQTIEMDIEKDNNIYIPRVQWTTDPDILSVIRLNRLQNHLEIIHFSSSSGIGQRILSEKSDTYVDIYFCDDLTYLSDGKSFIYPDRNHGIYGGNTTIHLYSMMTEYIINNL